MNISWKYGSRAAFGAALLAGVLIVCGISGARAATVDELKGQIEAKNAEIKKIQEELLQYNTELSKTTKTSTTLKEKITQLNANINSLRKQITLTETRIKQKQLEIQELQILITEKAAEIQERRIAMADIMQDLAERQGTNTLEAFLLHGTLSDFFTYIEQNKNFQKELQANLTEFQELKKELEDEKVKAEKNKKELARYQITLADKKIITESERKDREVLLAETKNQEKKYQQLVSETEKKYEEMQKEIEKLENELRLQVDAKSLPPRREGLLAWPATGRMSQDYGETAFARNSHFYKFHNGIDIAGPSGTEVVAAEAGRVVSVGNSDLYCPRGAYGKFVVIDHGNNLVSLYAHLSLIKVSSGMTVERGQLIGYMGATGRVTGPHLHFTVYDAQTFELRQTKVCGILPFGGSVNPLDYL